MTPDGDQYAAAAREALRKPTPLDEARAGALTWIRVDGAGLKGAHFDQVLFELAQRLAAASHAPLEAVRAPCDPLTSCGKGLAFFAFAADGYADVTDATHELRLLGYTVAPIAYMQVRSLLD
jgi:hypothetical protein